MRGSYTPVQSADLVKVNEIGTEEPFYHKLVKKFGDEVSSEVNAKAAGLLWSNWPEGVRDVDATIYTGTYHSCFLSLENHELRATADNFRTRTAMSRVPGRSERYYAQTYIGDTNS